MGFLDCVIGSVERGYHCDEESCSNAASIGNLEILKYLHEIGCPWDKWTIAYAAKKDDDECLKYAFQNGCPYDQWASYFSSFYGNL